MLTLEQVGTYIWGEPEQAPHNVTALQDVCVCMCVCLHTLGHIQKILIERTEMKVHVNIKMFCAMSLLNTTKNSSPCNSMPINLQIASGARLQSRCQREQERKRSEQTKARQGRLDRQSTYTVRSLSHSVDPSVWS